MRKNMLFVVLALMVGLSAGIVSAQDDLAAVDPSGQTVVYWHQFTEQQAATMQQLIDEFNETNEWGIIVEPIHQGSYNDIRDQMSAAIISGELPNLVAGYANDAASYYLDNAAVDIRPYMESAEWGLSEEQLADLNPGILAANTFSMEPYNGEILAWPHQNSAQVLVVNMDMLNELGYDAPPQTFEEFKEIACAAAELTGPNGEDIQGFPISSGPESFDASIFETFVAARGGNIYHDGTYDLTSDAVVETLQFFQELYNEGCGYIPAERFGNTADFALGLNPMATTSTAGFPFIINDIEASGSDINWVVSTLPFTDDNRTLTVFVPSIILVPGTPEQQLASWLFLEYLVSPEAAATWAQNTGYFTPVLSANEIMSAETFANAALFPYYDASVALQNDPAINIYTSPNIPSYGTVRNLISEAVAAVTTGGEDPVAAAEELQEQALEALEG